jgi:predicted phage gp36 major capsid-like protein
MELHRESMERPLESSLKATYRALLARGLEVGEAANLTAFLHGLPSDGFHWTLPEVEAVIRRRLAHAADERLAAATSNLAVPPRNERRSSIHDRRVPRARSTHLIDQPKP